MTKQVARFLNLNRFKSGKAIKRQAKLNPRATARNEGHARTGLQNKRGGAGGEAGKFLRERLTDGKT